MEYAFAGVFFFTSDASGKFQLYGFFNCFPPPPYSSLFLSKGSNLVSIKHLFELLVDGIVSLS